MIFEQYNQEQRGKEAAHTFSRLLIKYVKQDTATGVLLTYEAQLNNVIIIYNVYSL